MHPLVNKIISAHGASRWRDVNEIHLDLEISGAIWAVKGQADLFSRFSAVISTREQKVLMQFPDSAEHHAEYTPHQTSLQLPSGAIERRDRPRDHFDGHFIATPWDSLDAIYFSGYALWTYFNHPFLLANPDVTIRAIAPWKNGDDHWDRLQITYPDEVTTHGRQAVMYVGNDGLMRRYDYGVDIMAGAFGANLALDYASYEGILLPSRRMVYAFDPTGHTQGPALVDIRLVGARFA